MSKKIIFNEYDEKFLKNNWNSMTIKELANKLNKSEYVISKKLKEFGLIKQVHTSWSDDDIEFLKLHYDDMTSEEIGKRVNHSVNAVNSKRQLYNLWKTKPWNEKDIQYLKDNYMKMSHLEIGKILHRTDGAIRAKCFDLGLFKKELPWTDYELDFVKKNYREMKTNAIAEILNRTPSAIKLKAERMGIKKYPYYCDYDYFKNIDTEEKAYWLGFLTADGWININKKTNAGTVGIELQYDDINHLKKFNKSIGGNYKITDRWRTCPLSKYDDKSNHTCCLRIFSLTMYKSLTDIGFTNNKTFDASIPQINKDLIKHYIRGFFDGDGWIVCTNKSLHIGFVTASKQFNSDIINIITNNGIKINNYSSVSEYGTTLYRSEICTKKDIIEFLNWIYDNSSIYLNRKYKKYLKVKNKYETDCLAS